MNRQEANSQKQLHLPSPLSNYAPPTCGMGLGEGEMRVAHCLKIYDVKIFSQNIFPKLSLLSSFVALAMSIKSLIEMIENMPTCN